ncbi:hypothetical protein [Haloarchaeobius sp. DT45]|uniref:hypothetical protein n=1 Tax=Haloarchaeobius sp. DT45 TaxID=3446116 RepID=UPI003F6D7F20
MNVRARIDELEAEVERAEQTFDPPADPDDRARRYCREGVGPTVVLYVDCRTGGPHLPAEQCSRLEAVLNRWLDLYGRCYGVDLNTTFPLRTAAELLIETHSAVDVAQLLTTVPERH